MELLEPLMKSSVRCWVEGHGLHGQSYAIDTMSGLDGIAHEVATFPEFAGEHPELRFFVTEIGCGMAGYTPQQVAPLFVDVPHNVVLPENFVSELKG